VRIGAPQPLDLTREANGALHLIVEYRVDEAPTGEVLLGVNDSNVPITGFLRGAQPGQWTSLSVPLQCFARAGADFQRIVAPFVLRTGGRPADGGLRRSPRQSRRNAVVPMRPALNTDPLDARQGHRHCSAAPMPA
jgi:hypothetical protein